MPVGILSFLNTKQRKKLEEASSTPKSALGTSFPLGKFGLKHCMGGAVGPREKVEYWWELPTEVIEHILGFSWVQIQKYQDCTGRMRGSKQRKLVFPNVVVDPDCLTVRMMNLGFRHIAFSSAISPSGKKISYILARNKQLESIQFKMNTEQLKIINNRRVSSKRKLPSLKNLVINGKDIQDETLYHWNYFVNESKFGTVLSDLESITLKHCKSLYGYQIERLIGSLAAKKIPLKTFFLDQVECSSVQNFKKLKHFPLETLNIQITHGNSEALTEFLLKFSKTLKRLKLTIKDQNHDFNLDRKLFPHLKHVEIVRN